MKSFLRKFLVTVSLLSIITIQVEANTLAPPNVQLLGDANGLVHIPEDDLFLHYPNMLPGDSIKRTLEIKNDYEYPYELFLRAERVSPEEEYDLLNKLELTIKYKDTVIYAGPTSGEYELTDDISLGIFDPGQEETLVAEVLLDGPSTGNEYKNKYAEVDWIFTAIRIEDVEGGLPDEDIGGGLPDEDVEGGLPDEEIGGGLPDIETEDTKPGGDNVEVGKLNDTDRPKTGDNSSLIYVALGTISILLLIIIRKKSYRNEKKNTK